MEKEPNGKRKKETISSNVPYSCVNKGGSDSITPGAICRPSLLGRCFLGPKRWMFHAQVQTIQRIPLNFLHGNWQAAARQKPWEADPSSHHRTHA
jgi:hypothetical protein